MQWLKIVAVGCMLGASSLAVLPAMAQDGSEGPTAEDQERAKGLYENGETLYNEGRYALAIKAWEEAYKLSKHPVLLYNIADAYERMNELEKAIEVLDLYRVEAAAEERDALSRRVRVLEERLAAQKAQNTPDVPDPNPNGTGENGEGGDGTNGGQGGDGTNNPDQNNVVPDPDPDPLPEPPPKKTKMGPWVLLGAGAAGIGTSAVFGLQAAGARTDAASVCTTVGETILCPQEADAWIRKDRRSSMVSDVSLGAGIILAGTGLSWALMESKGLQIGPRYVNGPGVGLRGQFK